MIKMIEQQTQPVTLEIKLMKIERQSKQISQRLYNFVQIFSNLIRTKQYEIPHNYSQTLLFSRFEYQIKNPKISLICSNDITQTKTKTGFSCLDCMSNNLAIICYQCFINSNHEGHTYKQYKNTIEGICDCGNQQMWNPKGFCCLHNHSDKKYEIEPQIRDIFLKQNIFLFQLYFWLVQDQKQLLDKDQIVKLRQAFGTLFFIHLGNVAHKCLETKILIYELLSSRNASSMLLCNKQFTILQKLFLSSVNNEQTINLKKCLMQLFPYEPSRQLIVKLLFKLTSLNIFTKKHPLKSITHQFFTCQKLIIKLIKNKDIQPLSLNHNIQIENFQLNYDLFTSYFDNLYYISENLLKKQYFIMHLQTVNVAQMACFRPYTNLQTAFNPKLDHTYIYTIMLMMKDLKQQKAIIKKCLHELYQYLISLDTITFSLAQQRAFAIFIMLACSGNLQNIKQPQFIKDYQLQLNIQVIQKMIKRFLKNKSLVLYVEMNQLHKQVSSHLSKYYTEKYMLNHLDSIYLKSLILLKNDNNLNKIVSQVIDELQQQDIQSSSYIIVKLCSFLTQVFTTTLDQIVISNVFDQASKQSITNYYLRLLKLYNKKISPQKFKVLGLSFINNQNVLSQVVKNYAILNIQKLNIQLSSQKMGLIQTLPFAFYSHLLINFPEDNSQSLKLSHKPNQKSMLSNMHVSDKLVLKLIQNLSKIIQLKSLSSDYLEQFRQSLAVLTKIQLLKHNNKIQQSLFKCLQSPFSKDINKLLYDQILILCKRQKGQTLLIEQANLQNKILKKQKLNNKKRIKDIIIKQRQQKILKNVQKTEEKDENKECCIYCKQVLKGDIYYMAFLGVTNLIEKNILNNNDCHLFLSTCGHKVHKECYYQFVKGKCNHFKCFLCKKHTNMIIPRLSTKQYQQGSQNLKKTAKQLFDYIYETLLSRYVQDLQFFNNKIWANMNGNINQGLLMMIIKQMLINGLHNYDHYINYCLPVHRQIYIALKIVKNEQNITLGVNYEQQQQYQQKVVNDFRSLQKYICQRLLNSLSGQSTQIQNSLQLSICDKIQRLIEYITSEKQVIAILFESQENILISSNFIQKYIPKEISQLHKYMGVCQFCLTSTSELHLCILCGWRSCHNQNNIIYNHINHYHFDGSIFINTRNGEYTVLYGQNMIDLCSIYKNQFLQDYKLLIVTQQKQNISKFQRNQIILKKIYKMLIGHTLQNELDDI